MIVRGIEVRQPNGWVARFDVELLPPRRISDAYEDYESGVSERAHYAPARCEIVRAVMVEPDGRRHTVPEWATVIFAPGPGYLLSVAADYAQQAQEDGVDISAPWLVLRIKGGTYQIVAPRKAAA